MFSQAKYTRKIMEEAKIMAEDEAQKLSLAQHGIVVARAQAEASLLERSVKLQALRATTDAVCACLSPPPPVEVALPNRMRALPSHVECVVLMGALHDNCISLWQMVSHFDEIDTVIMVEGFATGQSDEELDRIEE
jgi:hypothetical protein